MAEAELQLLLQDGRVNLANLPADIIRRIVRLSGDKGLSRLRLISPTWNAVVKEFLTNRRLHPSIECVRMLSGRPHWPDRDVRVSIMIAPHVRADFRGAFRGWTECSWAIPIDSPVLRLRMIRLDNCMIYFIIFLVILAFILITYFVHPLIAISVGLIAAAAFARWWHTTAPGVTENRACLSRIFARCSSIGQLLFLNLDRNTVKIARETLADVPIPHLMVVGRRCDEELRKTIVEMSRVHKIEQIAISATVFKMRNFRNFLFDLDSVGTVKELEILENVLTPRSGQHRRYWEKIAREIRHGPYFVQIMEEERYNLAEGTHLLRLRLKKERPVIVIA